MATYEHKDRIPRYQVCNTAAASIKDTTHIGIRENANIAPNIQNPTLNQSTVTTTYYTVNDTMAGYHSNVYPGYNVTI